jgi:hypothetical protein
MKTTIELPDDPFHKAKVRAAEDGTTLKDIISMALEAWFRIPGESEKKRRKARVKFLLNAMRADNKEPMKPMSRQEIYDR